MPVSYIDLINSFWDLATTSPLSTGQVSLYFALLHVCNRSNWIEWFAAPNQVLSVLSGLSRTGIQKARNELKQRGLIDFRDRGTKATTYRLISPTIAKSVQVCVQNGVQNSVQIGVQDGVQIGGTLKESEIDKEKKSISDDIPEKPAREPVDYKAIADLYNSVCVSLRPIKSLSEKRKKAIRARMAAGRTLEDFKQLFELAEGSSFLKGKNNLDWSADFDWLVADANMAKVLDGKYANRDSGGRREPDVPSGTTAESYYSRYLKDGDSKDSDPLPER